MSFSFHIYWNSIGYSILVIIGPLLGIWLAWHVWTFTVFPWLHPYEPRQLPYLVPWLGHTISFMRSAEKLYDRGNRYFPDKKPYGITIAGSTTVVITDTADLAALWRNTTALSYDPFVRRMLTAFGTSKTSVQRVFQEDFTLITPEQFRGKTLLSTENPHGKCYMHMQSEWFKKQLLPGAGLDELQNKYFRHLKHIMNIEYLQGDFSSLQNSSKRPRSVTVYLGKLNRWVLSYATFRAFFGKALFEIEPMFAQIYQKWEDDSWKVFYNYPYALAKDLHHARTQAIEVLAKYYELPLRERETCWLFRIMDIEMQAIGLSRKDRAGMVMMICWALNNNAHYICSWMVAHMLSDQELIKVVRDETDLCFTPDGECDLHKLITACPTLDAIWNEVLRLYNASTAVRKASEDCVIGGKNIHKGDQIFGPVRNWQLDKQYFGEKADQFNASRWTETKGLTRSRGFTPFGGGHTYCPGRYFAQREIYSYIAVLLQNFRLNVTDSSGTPIMNPKVPPVETNLPAPAAMRPVYDILITLTKRRDQA